MAKGATHVGRRSVTGSDSGWDPIPVSPGPLSVFYSARDGTSRVGSSDRLSSSLW